MFCILFIIQIGRYDVDQFNLNAQYVEYDNQNQFKIGRYVDNQFWVKSLISENGNNSVAIAIFSWDQ